MNLAFVVKLPSGQYLADRHYHRSQTPNIVQAKLFLTEEAAEKVRSHVPKAAVTTILMAEYEPA